MILPLIGNVVIAYVPESLNNTSLKRFSAHPLTGITATLVYNGIEGLMAV